MSVTALQMKNTEALNKLKSHAKEYGDDFKIKLKRQERGQALAVTLAKFAGAQYVHFASPEEWVTAFGGGGIFTLEAIGGKDDTDSALGFDVMYESTAPALPINTVNKDALQGHWLGPRDLTWSIADPAARAPGVRLITDTQGTRTAITPVSTAAQAEARVLEERRQSLEKQERELALREAATKADAERKRIEAQLDEAKRDKAALERKIDDDRAENKRQLEALRQQMETVAARAAIPAPAPDNSLAVALLEITKQDKARAEAAEERRQQDLKEERVERQRREDKEEARRRDDRERDDRLLKEREERAALQRQDDANREERREAARKAELASVEAARKAAEDRLMAKLTEAKPAMPQLEGVSALMETMTTMLKNTAHMAQMAADLTPREDSDSDLVKLVSIAFEGIGNIMKTKLTVGPMTPLAQAAAPQAQLPAAVNAPQPSAAVPVASAPVDPVAALTKPMLRLRSMVVQFVDPKLVALAFGEEWLKSAQSTPPGTFHLLEVTDVFNQIAVTLEAWFETNKLKAMSYLQALKVAMEDFIAKGEAAAAGQSEANGVQGATPAATTEEEDGEEDEAEDEELDQEDGSIIEPGAAQPVPGLELVPAGKVKAQVNPFA